MIRVLISISGRVDGQNLEAVGSEHHMNPVIEAQLVAQGYAELLAEPKPEPKPKPVETATVAAPENTAKHTTRPQPRRKA